MVDHRARRGLVGSDIEPAGPPPRCRMRPSHSLSCSTVSFMGTANVWILGGYQSDFARNLTREGHDFADLTAEVVDYHARGGQDRRRRHRRGPRRQRVRRDVRPPGPPRRDARQRQRRAVGHPRVPPRSRLRIRQRRDPGGDRRPTVRRVPHRPRRRRRTGEDGARRHRRAAPRRRRLDRPRGRRREVHVAVHVRPGRRRVRPPLRHRRGPPAGHRPTELRQRPRQPQRADPRLDGARSADRRRRSQPGRSRAGCAGSTAAR